MRDQLLNYYERELRFIRRMASEFAAKYPAIAGSLMLEPEKCEDPHVERIIEAFAMLSARVHLRLDDEFPELANALLSIVYPHYTAPTPSMTIVQMDLDPSQSQAEEGTTIDRGAVLFSKPVDSVRCRFRTCYPVTLWPVTLTDVSIKPLDKKDPASLADAACKICFEFKTMEGMVFADLAIKNLRFFLNGESTVVNRLYEVFFNEANGILLRSSASKKATYLGPEFIRPVGFEKDEGMLEYAHESFVGYRYLQEYFTFPDKFLFMEIQGLEETVRKTADDTLKIEVLLEKGIQDLEGRVSEENFQMNCAPAINLFPMQADPISLKHTRVEHPVIPDVHSPFSHEVYSITEVFSSSPGKEKTKSFRPFYSLQHGNLETQEEPAFWHPVRKKSLRRDDTGTDLFLMMVDRDFQVTDPPTEVLNIDTLCTNRDLPARLPFGDKRGDFQIEGHPEITKICCLRKPTNTIREHLEDDARWKLISHLSLNYLSIAESAFMNDAEEGPDGEFKTGRELDAFHEILKLYDFADSAVNQKRISGIEGIRSRRVTRRLKGAGSVSFVRGVELSLNFDEENYAGTSVFLMASVLERFLGHYASINSFVQTNAYIRQKEGVLKRWPPRAGQTQLL